ncbi:hypothetical protein [Psychromonas ossibalaenae]|uniref:hypothetical protein n=1 Tax=Psychromonas ossibalaenae TaxID=444922 RepID=UPI0003613D7D|nr:hypothetical protein [Psychromonas ossibalaenae]
MKKLFALAFSLMFVSSAFAKKPLTETQVENCIYYDEKITQKEGNINRLKEVMNEIDDKIDSFDYKLDRIESALTHTIGSKRSYLINDFNSINYDRDNYVALYNKALKKQNLRVDQHNKYLDKYNRTCKNATIRKSTHGKVCGNKNANYCDLFDFSD